MDFEILSDITEIETIAVGAGIRELPKTLRELLELPARATQEQELYSHADWEFLFWLAETYAGLKAFRDNLCLTGADLLRWLAQWGQVARLEQPELNRTVSFAGEIAELAPNLGTHGDTLLLAHDLRLPGGAPALVRGSVLRRASRARPRRQRVLLSTQSAASGPAGALVHAARSAGSAMGAFSPLCIALSPRLRLLPGQGCIADLCTNDLCFHPPQGGHSCFKPPGSVRRRRLHPTLQ